MVSDNDGPYYWHIKSGTIQREVPAVPNHEKVDVKNNFSKETENLISKFENSMISSVTRSSTSFTLDLDLEERKKKDELAFKYERAFFWSFIVFLLSSFQAS